MIKSQYRNTGHDVPMLLTITDPELLKMYRASSVVFSFCVVTVIERIMNILNLLDQPIHAYNFCVFSTGRR